MPLPKLSPVQAIPFRIRHAQASPEEVTAVIRGTQNRPHAVCNTRCPADAKEAPRPLTVGQSGNGGDTAPPQRGSGSATCDAGADRAWLRKIRPTWGHNYHFHVRLDCGGGPTCRPQQPPPPGDGCGAELDTSKNTS